MAKASILLVGICAFAVQGSVLRNEDAVLKRQARSPVPCDECDISLGFPAPPPPPPPPPPPGMPPVFHTQQWSGLTHSNDGQGVFSGAAASIDGGAQTGSQAFSLASAAGGDGTNEGTVAPELLSNRFGIRGSDSFGQSSGGDIGFGGQSAGFAGGKKFSGSKSSFKESHFSIQSGDQQFGKGFGLKDGETFYHQQFYGAENGHGGFGGNGQSQRGLGVGSASQSSSYASSSRNNGDAGAIQNSDNEGQHIQAGQLHPGSGFGGGSSSASSASSAFSGNQQQQLGSQKGFASGIQDSGFTSTGRLEGSGYDSQNAQIGHSGAGYHSYGKSNEFSSNEQQQQNLQLGSQKGFESDGPSGIQESGFGTSGQFEGGNSAFGKQNAQYGQSGSGYHTHGQSNGFYANQQQQQNNAQFGQLHSGQGFGASDASSASSASSGIQQQQHLNHGSQAGFESDGGSQSQRAGFGSAGQLVGESSGGQVGQSGQQGSSFTAYGKSNGFYDKGQQQQQNLQLGSQTGFDSGAGSVQGGFDSGSSSSSSSQSSGSSSGSYGSNQQEPSDLHTGLGGALQLAAQGLKQGQEQNSGCSTCGKGSYALSNAKSHSGSAIALSVAG